jgi:hypothetical protein
MSATPGQKARRQADVSRRKLVPNRRGRGHRGRLQTRGDLLVSCWKTTTMLTLALLAGPPGSSPACAGTLHAFLFGSRAGGSTGSVVGRTTATLDAGGLAATFVAGPTGAVLDDSNVQGLGIDSRSLSGASDVTPQSSPTKLNLIDGTHPLAGSSEWLEFSFSRHGVLRTLLLDGVKDETLEFAILQLPDGTVRTVMDSQAEYRLNLQGYGLSDLGVARPSPAQEEDDDLGGLDIAFRPGERFRLSYGEFDGARVPNYRPFPQYPPEIPQPRGDGWRFQGVIVEIPEPAAAALAAAAGLTTLRRRRRRR